MMHKKGPVVVWKLGKLQRRSISGLSIASMTLCKLGTSPPQARLEGHLPGHNSRSQLNMLCFFKLLRIR